MIGKKYQQVVQFIREQITNQCYLPDEKLPSIRALSQQLQVSKNTVIRGYEQLEAAGDITPHPRSGFRVSKLNTSSKESQLPPSEVDLIGLSKVILSQPFSPCRIGTP